MASRIVTRDLEKSYTKRTEKINAIVEAAVKEGVIPGLRTPSGKVVPASQPSEAKDPKSS